MKKRNLLIILVLLVLFSVGSIGCSSEKEKMNFQDIILSDWKDTKLYDEESFMSMFDEYSYFDVKKVKKEQDYFVITCDVTSPDILEGLKAYQQSITESVKEDEMNLRINELISSSELKTSEQVVKVFAAENQYLVEYTEGFIDAMYGYSYLYCYEQINNMVMDILG